MCDLCLVVDLEPGRERNLWIVLAKEWRNDGENTFDGDYMGYAPQVVDRDDDFYLGVLPGETKIGLLLLGRSYP